MVRRDHTTGMGERPPLCVNFYVCRKQEEAREGVCAQPGLWDPGSALKTFVSQSLQALPKGFCLFLSSAGCTGLAHMPARLQAWALG